MNDSLVLYYDKLSNYLFVFSSEKRLFLNRNKNYTILKKWFYNAIVFSFLMKLSCEKIYIGIDGLNKSKVCVSCYTKISYSLNFVCWFWITKNAQLCPLIVFKNSVIKHFFHVALVKWFLMYSQIMNRKSNFCLPILPENKDSDFYK